MRKLTSFLKSRKYDRTLTSSLYSGGRKRSTRFGFFQSLIHRVFIEHLLYAKCCGLGSAANSHRDLGQVTSQGLRLPSPPLRKCRHPYRKERNVGASWGKSLAYWWSFEKPLEPITFLDSVAGALTIPLLVMSKLDQPRKILLEELIMQVLSMETVWHTDPNFFISLIDHLFREFLREN